eukprot:TRINITY_DN39641_c0_g1_i1.p1 TRINITY_DN39641_c0_g1~~TRINITY_DN39641_c0_g1_i1.p1  ORF type:complete len:185 (-),score=39.97 TRINITY_DN39641_c0_g1_i1:60-614(-)
MGQSGSSILDDCEVADRTTGKDLEAWCEGPSDLVEVCADTIDATIDQLGIDSVDAVDMEDAAYKKKGKGSKKPLLNNDLGRFHRPDSQVTPLMSAAQYGTAESVRRLIDDEGELLNRKDHRGWTALHYAANELNYDTFEELLKSGADPGRKDPQGRTAVQVVMEDSLIASTRLQALVESNTAPL